MIQKETVSELLWDLLVQLMKMEELNSFRLVGGTALSLHLGHRMSVDIDLFSDAEYRSIDFENIYKLLKKRMKYISHSKWVNNTVGNSCFIGESTSNSVKLDLYYTDVFVYPIVQHEHIRISSLEEIIAMKLDVICRGGRKKDFWDIHALLEKFTLTDMLTFYAKRYPYSFTEEELKVALIDFSQADEDPDPICLHGKYWELIKLDFEELLNLL